MERNITKIFSECQATTAAHNKLVKKLINIYLKSDFEKFCAHFLHLLKYSLIHGDKQPSIERTLSFIAKFTTSVKSEKEEERNADEIDEQQEEVVDPFLVAVFQFLLKNHEANSRAVRYRVCQLINRVLNSMGEQATIDDELYNKIYDTMLQRLMDKVPTIRLQAIHALSRLQEPRNKECPVIKAYLFHLSMDPNPEVRRAVLDTIAISFQTLPSILERIRDTRDLVRKQAYILLAQKVHLRSFTIAQRILIVSEGLNDRSEIVRQAVRKNVLQAWLRLVNGNLLELLKCLDVEASTESAELALNSLFEGVPGDQLVENLASLMKGKVISYEQLTAESALLWKCLAKHLRSNQEDEHLDEILPDLSAFSNYLRDYIMMKAPLEEDPQETAVKMMEKDFVCQQLITLSTLFDMGDEVGKKNLCSLVRELFLKEAIGEICIKNLVEVFIQLYPPVTRVSQLMEIISDLRETPESSPSENPQESLEKHVATPKVTEEEQRKHKIKVAKIRVEINQVREELEECIRSLDLERAQFLKQRLQDLEEEKDQVMEEVPTPHTTPLPVPSQQKMPEVEEELKLREDPETMSRCLHIVCEVLSSVDLTTLGSLLRSLHDNLILPCLKSEVLRVRKYAVRALALVCLLSQDLAQQHLLLFIQISQMDVEEIQVEALNSLFDFWLLYGVEEFNAVAEDVHDLPGFSLPPGDSQGSPVGNMIAILTKMLEVDSSEARTLTAEGLCKLLLASRIESSKLLSHLILLWYNPTTEEDHMLRHMLGVFFPLYASMGGANQESLCGALLPTLHTIFSAPAKSPLNDVDVEDVVDFLVSITSPSIVSAKAKQPVNAHDSLVFLICAEVLAFPDRDYIRPLIKCLPHLVLTPSAYATHKQVVCLAEKMSKKVTEKVLVNCISKFLQSVQRLLQCAPEAEQENKDLVENVSETEVSQEADSEVTRLSIRRKRVLYSSQNDMELLDSENEQTPSKAKRLGSEAYFDDNSGEETSEDSSSERGKTLVETHNDDDTVLEALVSSADEIELTVEEEECEDATPPDDLLEPKDKKTNTTSSDIFDSSSPERTRISKPSIKLGNDTDSKNETITSVTPDEEANEVDSSPGHAASVKLRLPLASRLRRLEPASSSQKRKPKPSGDAGKTETSTTEPPSSSPSYYSARSTSASPESTPPASKRLRNLRTVVINQASPGQRSLSTRKNVRNASAGSSSSSKKTATRSVQHTPEEGRITRLSSTGRRQSTRKMSASSRRPSLSIRSSVSSETTEDEGRQSRTSRTEDPNLRNLGVTPRRNPINKTPSGSLRRSARKADVTPSGTTSEETALNERRSTRKKN